MVRVHRWKVELSHRSNHYRRIRHASKNVYRRVGVGVGVGLGLGLGLGYRIIGVCGSDFSRVSRRLRAFKNFFIRLKFFWFVPSASIIILVVSTYYEYNDDDIYTERDWPRRWRPLLLLYHRTRIFITLNALRRTKICRVRDPRTSPSPRSPFSYAALSTSGHIIVYSYSIYLISR